ncbi:MAG: hypothetical protein A2076_12700 [Geobacteraceae bacterium GWC2_53_11]|nr:MAG: hypothetical protein A2076_12700 [Geobacteraceae bacterium GWC2_53_11]
MSETLIKVDGISKKFCRNLKRSLWYGMQDLSKELWGQRNGGNGELRPDEFWAVNDVSFELKRGECLGLIGHNGAGKTTLLRMLNGLIKPDRGRIEMRGRVGALIALGAGFNPVLTGRENIYVNASVLGLSKQEIDDKFDEILDFAELGEFIDAPVQSYSSGMQVRLGFAVATTLEPDILLLDEVLAVGDASFRSKCWRRIGSLLSKAAVILVSHEAYAISRLCDKAIYIKQGNLEYYGDSNNALKIYSNANKTYNNDVFTVTNKSVKSVEFESGKAQLLPGDSYEFSMYIHMNESVNIDHAVINIIDQNEEVHAQSLLEFNPTSLLLEGLNVFHVKLGPLYLSQNSYDLSILLSINGGKQPLIHSKSALGFLFKNHICYGPKYYPPGSASKIN